MFELNSLALSPTSLVHLRHPETDEPLYDSEGNPVTVELFSTGSKEYRKAQNAMADRVFRRFGTKKPSSEVMDEEGTKLLVAATKAVNNMALNGELITTDAQLTELYSDGRYLWVRAQVNEALGDVANFLSK